MQVSLLLIVTILAGALALWDGIVRVRGRHNSIVSIIQIVAAALMLLALFGIVVTSLGVGILAVILVILLVVQLVLRGSTRRGGAAVTVIALVLNAIVAVVAFGLVSIPGLN